VLRETRKQVAELRLQNESSLHSPTFQARGAIAATDRLLLEGLAAPLLAGMDERPPAIEGRAPQTPSVVCLHRCLPRRLFRRKGAPAMLEGVLRKHRKVKGGAPGVRPYVEV
jgi:hypothetical protein